ncbi:MAG TPA: alpha/beta hydrolase-fold protein [Candidatus Acidoferrales bacterium]|nr:alpha/beta hydrolase-fold protein [Candidatus Acidoferrales bacterium]
MRRASFCAAMVLVAAAWAQPPAGRGQGGGRGPVVVSPEVLPDSRVVVRIAAPKAATVTLNAGDIPGNGGGRGGPQFTKGENDVWEATVGPVPAGAFRYVFQVDGVRTLDPVNTKISESNAATWSLFYVPGLDFMDVKDVPHGAVASVYYRSGVLNTTRRMHVYTPPGYETSQQKYPVFYLLHGAGDSDESWTSVGRAGFILDNLIAAGKAKPMIVVMTAGHQPGTGGRGALGPPTDQPPPFTSEFVTDVMPYVEKHYRVIADRPHRAIAGLSMGGSQTLDIAFRHLKEFGYIGVFSSGHVLGGGRGGRRGAAADTAASTAPPPPPPPPPPDWETVHQADLDNAALKKGTRLVWLSTGSEDGLLPNSKATVEMLKKHGFNPVFQESPGGHTWINWRNYLNEFTPQLFQ